VLRYQAGYGFALNMLGKYGCDRAQGYFLGRPCPAHELTPQLVAAVAAPAAGASH
jgi:EAL domain-containing protein (putative c-di-GMP-specific phosphodiesterase class I)